MPNLAFKLHEHQKKFIDPRIAATNSKNVSYEYRSQKIKGTCCEGEELQALRLLMQRFATESCLLVQQLLPHYAEHLDQARTSFRPVEVKSRPSSYRKDDSRLHVDAFPSTPMAGKRILRVFSNIHPGGGKRHWRLGEKFEDVVTKFLPTVKKPMFLSARLLQLLRITRGYRTPYDHYMLHIHNQMKADEAYQKNADQIEFMFPSGSTWMVYTDQASHAAMAGQHLFEQSFYLPVASMQNSDRSPLSILEKAVGRPLV